MCLIDFDGLGYFPYLENGVLMCCVFFHYCMPIRIGFIGRTKQPLDKIFIIQQMKDVLSFFVVHVVFLHVSEKTEKVGFGTHLILLKNYKLLLDILQEQEQKRGQFHFFPDFIHCPEHEIFDGLVVNIKQEADVLVRQPHLVVEIEDFFLAVSKLF